jgi:hypothetical protein
MIALSDFDWIEIVINDVSHLIPSKEMIIEVVDTLPSFECVERLFRDSNRFINYEYPKVAQNKSFVMEMALYCAICNCLGQSYSEFIRAYLVCQWYGIVDGGLTNIRLGYDGWNYLSDALLPALSGELIYENQCSNIQKKISKKPDRLIRFSEYKKALEIIEKTNRDAVIGSQKSANLYKFIKYLFALKKRNALKLYQAECITQNAKTQCPFCGKLFDYGLGKGTNQQPPHCGAVDCERKYFRSQKPGKKPPGWNPDKRGKCKGCGSRTRRLDKESKICLSCCQHIFVFQQKKRQNP